MSISTSLKDGMRRWCNWHRQGAKPNIALFATARGGSTWIMELFASQPGMKFYDEPFNIRRHNVQKSAVFSEWRELMPEHCDQEKIFDYIGDLTAGRLGHMNPTPFRKNHRFLTDRIVFKIHVLEHMIDEFRQTAGCDIACLIRHPIPTSLSRHQLPRLDYFLRSAYYMDGLLKPEQARRAEQIRQSGSNLELGVLSWCFENVEIHRSYRSNQWSLLTYEECVLNPVDFCTSIANRHGLDDLDCLLLAAGKPSSNIAMSSSQVQDTIQRGDGAERARTILGRWKSKVDVHLEKQCMEILETFEIDFYRKGSLLPQHDHLLSPETTLSIAKSMDIY